MPGVVILRESDGPRRRRRVFAPRRRRQDHVREQVEDAEAVFVRPRDRPRRTLLHDDLPHLVHHYGLRAEGGGHRGSSPRRGS